MTDAADESARGRTGPDGPWRSTSFRWFFAARAVSVFGSAMTPVALAFAVLQLSDDQAFLGYVLAAELVPMVGLIILGGGIADRCRCDTLLVVTNLGAGVSQAGVAACVLARGPVVTLIPLAMINGALQAFTNPAMQGIVPQLVSFNTVQRANSMLAGARNAARVVGPSAAGAFTALVGGGVAIAIDAGSFVIAAGCLTRVALPTTTRTRSVGLVADLRDGWTQFRSTSWIWSMTLAFAVLNAIQIGVWQVLGPIIANRTFGAAAWGVILSIKAVGLLLMSALTLRIAITRPLVSGMTWMSLTAVPLLLLGMHAGVGPLAIGSFAAGLGSAYLGIAWDTARQTNIAPEFISRVTSYDDFGAFVTIPVGQLCAVPLASAFGAEPVALIGGMLYFVVALLPLGLPSVRHVTHGGPHAAVGATT